MRRAVPVIVASALGGLLLANFHSTPARVALDTSSSTSTLPTGDTTTTADASGQRSVDGADETNRYGDVQIRVTLSGGRIVDLQALHLPSDRERSAEISNYAWPILRQETLDAQSAQIDLVSGATYTSESYVESLQAALDRAGLH